MPAPTIATSTLLGRVPKASRSCGAARHQYGSRRQLSVKISLSSVINGTLISILLQPAEQLPHAFRHKGMAIVPGPIIDTAAIGKTVGSALDQFGNPAVGYR